VAKSEFFPKTAILGFHYTETTIVGSQLLIYPHNDNEMAVEFVLDIEQSDRKDNPGDVLGSPKVKDIKVESLNLDKNGKTERVCLKLVLPR